MAGVLQEAEDADSRAAPDPKCSVSWLSDHSLHFHIYYVVLFVPGMPCPLYCYYKWWGDGIGGGGWFI